MTQWHSAGEFPRYAADCRKTSGAICENEKLCRQGWIHMPPKGSHRKENGLMRQLGRRSGYFKYLGFVLPGFLIWAIFSFLPNIQIFYLAFIKWNGISQAKEFVGLENLRNLLRDSYFLPVLINSIVYIVALLIVQNAVALLLALILKSNTRFNRFFRTLFFSPLVLSSAIVAMIWGYMYDANFGVINTLLDAIGLHSLSANWLGLTSGSILCIVLVHIWHNMGYPITIILAGLQTIQPSLYEAAEVEGAGKITVFAKITFPLLLPTLLRVALLTIIGGAMAFDYAYALGSGGRGGVVTVFDTLSVFMYKSISMKSNVGFPSMIGLLLGVFVFIIFILQYIATKKVEDSIG
jgi:ABC-type sugar transport system permease subunit